MIFSNGTSRRKTTKGKTEKAQKEKEKQKQKRFTLFTLALQMSSAANGASEEEKERGRGGRIKREKVGTAESRKGKGNNCFSLFKQPLYAFTRFGLKGKFYRVNNKRIKCVSVFKLHSAYLIALSL